ncbi:maleylpyruvate isomerase N-terminal domain-containing protein [Kitasatospora sp. NPDC058115]|uniref:maleylpyruvate isomerase N-terminal domain-containing protein n=1 Tax=Kitasatospora sp. NPDC058115 TaxID=3346347 RepID=UPI0036D838D8
MILLELHSRSLELAAAVVDTVQPEQLVLATPCAGRPLRWLLEHMVGRHLGLAAAAAGAGPDPALWRDVPVHGDPAGAFRHSAARLTVALAAAAPHAAPLRLPDVDGGAPLPFDRAVGLQLRDTLVHAWDVAAALGSPARLIAAVEGEPPLAAALLAAADRPPGRAPAVRRPGAGAAGPFARTLALLGRDTAWALPAR